MTEITAAAQPAMHRIAGLITADTPSVLATFLASAKGGPVQITVNSPGGSAFAGLAAYGQLRAYAGPVSVIVEGVAASAASLIAIAASDVAIHAGSFIMIHDVRGEVGGTAPEMRKTADVLDTISASYRAAYVERTGREVSAVAAWMSEETWFSAEDAVSAGLADRVLSEQRIAAAADLVKFSNLPAALRSAAIISVPAIQPDGSEEGQMADPVITPPEPPAPVNPVLEPVAQAVVPPALVPQPATLAGLEGIVARSNGTLSADFIVAQLRSGATMDQARDAALTAIATAQVQRPAERIEVTRDERDTARVGMEAALSWRAGDKKADVDKGPGRVYAHMTLREMARSAVALGGGKPDGLDPLAIAGAALGFPNFMASAGMHTTSDFPLILGNVARKTLLDAYQAAPADWRMISRTVSHSDFKPSSYLRLSEAPALLEVPEHAEFKYGSMAESGESFALKTFGRIFAITRQAIINDDLSAFSRMPALFGRAAADLVTRTVWGILVSNPTLGDGTALFHSTRGNLAGAGTAIDETNLAAAQTAIRKVTKPTGEPMGLQARYLIVSPDKEFQARKLLATVFNLADGSANVSATGLTLIVSPFLTGNAWYLAVDPAAIEGIMVPFLNGVEEPRIEQRVGFEVDGVEVKAALDFNAAAIEWRGFYKNPGA